ncbi:hypothetical protein Tco_0464283 [Tanacetum coccineum]
MEEIIRTLLAYPNEKPRVIEQLLRQLKPYDFAWMIELAIEEFIGLTSCYPYDKLELIDNSFEANQAFDKYKEELLRAPTEGYGEAIVLPEINADHFEIKTNLLQLVQANPFYGREKLTQVDTFYNGLKENEQDSLNVAAGGNLLSKTTREALNIIENKSKVRYSRNRSNASRMNATSSNTDNRIDKLADQLSTLVEIVSKKVVTPAPVKAVEETCVTCGGANSWYNCPSTDNNQASVCAATSTYNQVNPPNRVSNQMTPPGFAQVQNNGQNMFNQNQAQGNNFNQGNNFHGNQASTLGTLPSNTIPNPKGEMKAITTRSGVAYEGPSILTNPSPKKVVERETEETTDKEQTNFQRSTAQIPPPVIPISIPEPRMFRRLYLNPLLFRNRMF